MPGDKLKSIGRFLIGMAILIPGGMTVWGMISSFSQLQSGGELDNESMTEWVGLTLTTGAFLMNAALLGLGLSVAGHIVSRREQVADH